MKQNNRILFFLSFIIAGLFAAKNFFPNNSFAACDPATGDYTDCYVDNNPEYNIDVYTYTPVPGDNRPIYPFDHPTDSNCPQLLTLTPDWNGSPPTVTSVANINPTDKDDPASWANHEGTGATHIGFGTTPGAEVRAPWAGYDIGGGYNVIVLHADENGITLKYTAEDDIVGGYTVYLENINVDPTIIEEYERAIETGRTFMLALDAGQRIGTARDEIFIALRDTGAFKDPRWLEWWLKNPDLSGPLPPELLALLNMPPTIATPTPPPLTCKNPAAKKGVYRPAACKDCGGEIKEPIKACAETFVMEQDTWFYIHEGNDPSGWDEDTSEVKSCADDRDDQLNVAYFERTWGGMAEMDITNTTVPFVGYYNFPPLNQEAKYLARYFTGSLVGKGPQNPVGSKQFNEELKAQAGVMSKVFSPEYLDTLRCQMIKAAGEDANESYQIPFKPNSNLPAPKKLADFNGRFKNTPCTEPKYPGSDATDSERMVYQLAMEQWLTEYEVWLGSDWAKLWPYIPLTTLKDAPGTLTLKVQRTPGTLSTSSYRLSFPHLATLYQATQELSKHLMPEFDQAAFAIPPGVDSGENGVIIAAPSEEELDQMLAESSSYCGYKLALGEATATNRGSVLAEDDENLPLDCTLEVELTPQGNGSYLLDWAIYGHAEPGYDWSDIGYSIDVNGQTVYHMAQTTSANFSTNPTLRSPGSIFVNLEPGSVVRIDLVWTNGAAFNIPNELGSPKGWLGRTVECTVNDDGTVDNCKISNKPPSQQPANLCKNPDRYTPPTCRMDAFSDINPNDPICSSPYPVETQMTAEKYRATFTQSQLNKLLADLNKCIDDCKAKYPDPDDSHERGICYEGCRWRKFGDYNPLILFRKMGLDTQIPLLGKTRDYTIGDFASGGTQKGIFDIFRPAEMSYFEDDFAKSNIGYSYQGTISDSPAPGTKESDLMKSSSKAKPGMGEFYFPYLGGIERAKQCVSKGILNPDTEKGKIISQQYCP